MRVVGTLHEADEDSRSKVKKGTEFPQDAAPADVFTLISGNQEVPYMKTSQGWQKILLDNQVIDAGTY